MLVLAEALIFCLVSAAIGLGLAALLFPVVKLASASTSTPGRCCWSGLALAVALASISGLPPAVRGMRLSIVDALAGR